jgi:pSer/pThr/pTyr-binding forkhead associated (FHA) protein
MSQVRYQLRNADGSKSIELADVTTVGRDHACDLVLTDPGAAPRHARLQIRADGVWLEDLGAADGTRVNGSPIVEPVRIRASDRIAFASEEFVFITESAAAESDPPAGLRRQQRPDPSRPGTPPGETALPLAAATPGPAADASSMSSGAPGTPMSAEPEHERRPGGAENATAEEPDDGERAHLEIASGTNAGARIHLDPRRAAAWELGSGATRDIVLSDDGVSDLHARILREGDRWKLVDEMSAAGTYVNGSENDVVYLNDGDVIRLGPVECVFRLAGERRPRDTVQRRTALVGAITLAVALLLLLIALRYVE